MEAIFERKTLLRAVNALKSVVPRKTRMPILDCVKMTATTSGVDFEATDLDTFATVRVDATVPRGGVVCVNRSALAAAIKADAGEFLTVAFDGNTLKVGAMVVVAQGDGEWPKAFCVDDPSHVWSFSRELIRRIDRSVRPVASTDETRYVLNGVYFDKDDAVATDGHRLHMVPHGFGPLSFGAFENIRPIIGSRAWDALVTLAPGGFSFGVGALNPHDDYTGTIPEKATVTAVAAAANVRVVTRLISGRYPDWRQVVPSFPEACFPAGPSCASFNVRALRTALKPHLAIDGTTRVHLNGTFALSTQNAMLGTAVNAVECERKGPDATTGFNSAFLRDAADALDDGQVTLTLEPIDATAKDAKGKNTHSAGPGLLTDGTVKCVVMPVRI